MRALVLAALLVPLALGAACRRGPPPAREDADHRVDPTAPIRVDATGLTFPLDGPAPSTLQAVRAFPQLDFDRPVFLGHAGDGTNRIFVLEQPGLVRVFPNDNDVEDAAVFLDIRDRVRTEHNEEGLLGLAFDPDYATNGFFYLYYSASKPRRVVVSRWRVARNDPSRADAQSEKILLEVEQPYGNHNGGTLLFGPDGKLYIGLGDGGAAGDPLQAGQDLTTRLAKILRYDVDDERGLVVPPDNPFVGRDGALPEIWAYGLRNPWRCSFDRQLGTMWCGDVGQDKLEEIDVIVKGGNYGWSHMEGTREYDAPRSGPADKAVAPIVEYGRQEGQSVTGGYVYRGTHLPSLRGAYLYGDYGTGNVWALVRKSDSVENHLVARVPVPSSFGEDEGGELYAVGHRGGLYRFEPTDQGGAAPAFPTSLSQTGLFTDTAALEPAPGLVPYDVNVELWSDGAHKRRWLVLPKGEHIGFAQDGAWTFPVGTVLVKHFELEVAPDSTRIRLETRAMVHERSGWAGYTYRWNDGQTDATLVTAPQLATYDVATADGTTTKQTWYFPSGSDCLRCHTPGYGEILGVRTRQLAGRTADSGMDLLADWNARGLFATKVEDTTTLPQHPTIADATASAEARARAYLDVNCAICHHPGGPAPGSMDLRVQTPLATTKLLDVRVEAPTGIADEHRIRKGQPQSSAIVARMRTRDRHAMPPLASTVPDAAAIALLSAWIAAL